MSNNDKWGALSMRDRAFLIREAVRNGITDVNTIRTMYNEQGEKIRLGVPYRTFEAGSDYDYFNASPENMPRSTDGHWSSRNGYTGQLLKSTNHPTYPLMLQGEKEAGYEIKQIGDREYSFPKEHEFSGESDNKSILTIIKENLRKLDERVWGTRSNSSDSSHTAPSKSTEYLPRRVRLNDSKTPEKSTLIENFLAENLRTLNLKAKQKGHNADDYFIPYIEEQEIRVPGVGRVTKNMLDSIAVNAKKAGIPWEEGVGLAFLETKGGAIPNSSTDAWEKNFIKRYNRKPTYEEIHEQERAMLNSSFARNFGGIHPQFLINDHEWVNRGWEKSKEYKDLLHDIKSPLEHGFTMYREGIYNTGNKYHTTAVKKEAKRIKELPIIQEWAEKSPYTKK